MFGCCLRATWVTSLTLGLLLAGCSEKKANDLSFRVSFACRADQEAADQLELRILKGGCEGSETVYEATLSRGDEAQAGDGIAAGEYGFAATALSEGRVLASSCVQVSLPTSDVPAIQLEGPDCDPPAVPEDGDAGQEGAEDPDQVGGAQHEGGQGSDAGASSCATDCKDPFPCTEDRCVKGECVHDPYTGKRECDGISCTEGDKCQSGSCSAGLPNNAACPDDGNPCTTETCEPLTGCNRDGAGGGSCDDQIDCTAADTCTNGICRGGDMCTGGAVCSAATGLCISCGGATDCDDGNPCTTDTCTVGTCNNLRNVGAVCNDNKSCTINDLCTATACAGTSTCTSDATCGGSTCRCNDAAKTLCSNTCVATATSAQNCGQCGRACSSGATCENSACKPAGASNCKAYRYNGHDYLVCPDALQWNAARDRCRSWGLGLTIIDDQAENDFLKANAGNIDRWMAASDRGNNGSKNFNTSDERACTLNGEEGKWYWSRPAGNANGDDSGDNFRALCAMASDTATTCSLSSASTYQNWRATEPNNDSCACQGFGNNCSDGEDCGVLYADATWNDSNCSYYIAFICESP